MIDFETLRLLNQLCLILMDWFNVQMSKEMQLNCYSTRFEVIVHQTGYFIIDVKGLNIMHTKSIPTFHCWQTFSH